MTARLRELTGGSSRGSEQSGPLRHLGASGLGPRWWLPRLRAPSTSARAMDHSARAMLENFLVLAGAVQARASSHGARRQREPEA